MISIFEYFEYRQYLKDFYEDRKKKDSFFSYRFIGARVGLHSTHLIRIFQQKRHITESSIPAFITLCKLKNREAQYFEALVAYNKSRSDKQAEAAFARLVSLSPLRVRSLTQNQYELFKKWYYSAIRILLSFHKFKGEDYADLAGRLSPPVSVPQAKKAVRLLENLSLIEKNKQDCYQLTDQFISTGAQWKNLAVRAYQKEMIGLAGEALDRCPKDDRDISTVSFAVHKNDLPHVKEMVRTFRESVLKFVQEADENEEVYQLNIQLFPLTRNSRKTG